jgi:2-dehydropantoate 2-reductase
MPGRSHGLDGRDFLRGNRIDLSWLSGKVVELGNKYGVPPPTRTVMYAMLKPYVMGKPA